MESNSTSSENDAPDAPEKRVDESDRPEDSDAGADLEYWVWAAGILTGIFVVVWGIAVAPVGEASLYIHIFGIPVVGALTLPVALWGIMRTVFRPPVFQWSRLVAFGVLLVVGYFGNVPMFAAPVGTSDWRTERDYRLPFDGEWYTLAGGESVGRNYHATTAAYRWGYDFAPLEDGERARGEGSALEDFYCWDRPILAPVSGEVVKFEDERKDMPPGEFDDSSVFGNHVVLRVRENTYLYVAQLKKGSVPVRPGDEVDRGDRIGRCGNSGRAVKPHVHVHLQDRLRFPVARGLPIRFADYRVNGDERVETGMPRGEGTGGAPEGDYVEFVGGE